ncbi:MAG TPA: MFS transporter [Ktedonobacterales bacterium]|nr:MFS transporter [Ktedonobacterales bacterium]
MSLETPERPIPAASIPQLDVAATPPVAQTRKPLNDWRVLLLVFTLAGVVESQAFGHLNAFRPIFLQQLGVPAAQIPTWVGILAATGFVIGLPLLPFWGVWADRYSRKLIIVRSAYIEGVLFTVAAFSPNVWVLAFAQLLGGFVFGNTGVMLAMLADATPRRRLGLAVGIASAGFPIGSSVGPYIGGLVVQAYSVRVLLFGDAILSALMGVTLTLIIHEEARVKAVGARVTMLLRAAVRDITASPVVSRLFILYFLAMFGVTLAQPFIPILLQRLYHGPKSQLPSTIGTTLTLAGIAMAITTPLWGRLGDVIGRWRTLPICLSALAIGIAAMGLAPALFPLQAAIVGIGLFQGGIVTTVVALLALLAPEERRASILNFSLLPSQLSWFIGPITGAGLALISLRAPFGAGALAACSALVMAFWLAGFARRQAAIVPLTPVRKESAL